MLHESIRLFRLYCELTPEMISSVTGIPLARYKKIELGKVEPDEKERAKLAKIFNIDEKELDGGLIESSRYVIRQNFDDNIFVSEEIKERVKITITDLTQKEKELILLIRNSDNNEANIEELIQIILKK